MRRSTFFHLPTYPLSQLLKFGIKNCLLIALAPSWRREGPQSAPRQPQSSIVTAEGSTFPSIGTVLSLEARAGRGPEGRKMQKKKKGENRVVR